jgi:hypothetical protein
LTRIGASIHVRDLTAPQGVVILSSPSDMIVNVTLPAGEESALAAEAGSNEPEVTEKGKKEKDEA